VLPLPCVLLSSSLVGIIELSCLALLSTVCCLDGPIKCLEESAKSCFCKESVEGGE
jgi:hypothetical protein